MVSIAVEAVPADSKPPVAVGVRISSSERHGFGASAPLSTRVSFLHIGRAVPYSDWRLQFHFLYAHSLKTENFHERWESNHRRRHC